jgi:uncharacterized membrane protein
VKAIKEFVKVTVVGGIVFLVPLILLGLVLKHAMAFASSFAGPIAAAFQDHRIAGVTAATIIAALMLLLLSFLAGLFARTSVGHDLARWLEDSLLGNLPQYRMVKTMADGLAQVEGGENLRPALVSIEGGWQLGYLLEEVRAGWVAVFLPQSPTPMSGTVMYMPAERVRLLDVPMGEAVLLVKRLGAGSVDALRSADLTPVPEGAAATS